MQRSDAKMHAADVQHYASDEDRRAEVPENTVCWSDEELARFVAESPYRPGAAEAILTGSGVSVWAVVAYAQTVANDLTLVTEMYDLLPGEAAAALAYYDRHRAIFDDWLASYHAAFN